MSRMRWELVLMLAVAAITVLLLMAGHAQEQDITAQSFAVVPTVDRADAARDAAWQIACERAGACEENNN